LITVALLFILLSAPLGWLISMSPQLGLTLLGVPTVWPPDIGENILTIMRQYFLFWAPSTTEVMTPVFGLGSAILITLGLYRLVRTRETTRSYLIIFWIVCIIPVLILNPRFTSVALVPSVLMLAAGLTSLISYWYRLFPLNPYARITGLIPIVILIGALIVSGLARHLYGYHYMPQVAPLFSNDLKLLPKDTRQLITSDKEFDFYAAVATHRNDLSVQRTPSADSIVVTQEARGTITGYAVTRIVTNGHTDDADRFYVMTRIQPQ
jgi:hypothetical protein